VARHKIKLTQIISPQSSLEMGSWKNCVLYSGWGEGGFCEGNISSTEFGKIFYGVASSVVLAEHIMKAM
jgi:hypothetical protein